MSDTVYRVQLALSTTGDLSASMGRIGAGAERAQSRVHALSRSSHEVGEAIESIGHKVGGFLEGVADKAIEVGKRIGEIGAVAGLALATYGVAHLNRELEETSVSLAAIFQNQGFAGNFTAATKLAGDEIARMKQDVKALPGDLGQLSAIMTTIATPAAQGGANADQIRQLAGRGMLVGKILGVQPEVVSRELANLLSGRAGAHNILGSRLGLIGDEAQRFNKESASQRVSEIQAKFNTPAMNAAAEAFSHTWIANWTTLIDNVKYTFLAPITSPLFEHVKRTVIEINEWFDRNHNKIVHFTEVVGNKLAAAWDSVVSKVEKLEPIISKVVDKIESLRASDVSNMLGGAGSAAIATKLLGHGISAGGSALGTVARLGGGAALGTAAPLAAGGVALLATGLVAAYGASKDLTDATSIYHDSATKLWQDIETRGVSVFDRLGEAMEKVHVDALVGRMGKDLLFAIDLSVKQMDVFIRAIDKVGEAFQRVHKWMVAHGLAPKDMAPDTAGAVDGMPGYGGPKLFRPTIAQAKVLGQAFAEAQAKRGGGGGAGTHIDKVEIRVEGNTDPSRVARLVLQHVKNLSRNPKSSPFVPDYAASAHNG